MTHIFQNKQNNKLYTIEHLVLDITHLNGNAFSGIYATPYKWDGEIIKHTKQSCSIKEIEFQPEKFVSDNFEIVGELMIR